MLFNIIFKIERYKWNKEYGIYVSNLGNFKDRYKRRLPIMVRNGGYLSVKTERGIKSAHRLVMLTWKPIPNAEILTVDHLDHNKRNNSLSNLEWVTKAENKRRAARDLEKKSKKTMSHSKQYILYRRKDQKILLKTLSVNEVIKYIENIYPNYFAAITFHTPTLADWIRKRARSNRVLHNKTLEGKFLIDYK